MKPIRLRARNYRTFPELDIQFEQGLVGILGELRDAPEGADSNGAGKSSILEAIDIALFGRRSLAGYLTRGGDVDELTIELTFEHAGQTYRARRTYSSKGRGKTSVDLERLDEGEAFVPGRGDRDDDYVETIAWTPLTRASAKETDALIVETLGLSRDTYRDSAYLRQGDGSYADPDRDPRQRKELLVEAVLGRDPVWPRLADQARQRRKTAQTQLERLAGETATVRELVAGKPAAVAAAAQADHDVVDAAGAVSTAELELEKARERYQTARDAAAARGTLQAELQAAEQTLAGLRQRETAAGDAARAIVDANQRLDELATSPDTAKLQERIEELRVEIARHEEAQREYDAAAREQARREGERNALTQRATQSDRFAADVDAKQAALEQAEHPHCQTCGQEVAGEARLRAIAAYVEEATAHREAAARDREEAAAILDVVVPPAPEGEPPHEQLRTVQGQLRAAQKAETERARLQERVRQLADTAASGPEAEELAAAGAAVAAKRAALDELEPVDLASIEAAGGILRRSLDAARAHREQALAEKARVDERLTLIAAAEQRLQDAAAETARLQADVDRDVLLERCYGRDGIPALIIENSAIPYLETEATRILGLLGTGFQVELRTQAENKTGGLRDTLDVVVIDPDGNEADFADGCSGGEQTRIGLALRIALARLLAHRRGAESRLLALDEPSYLDQAGMAALLDVLRGLEPDFDVILLVSHVPELRDALDQTITVVKEHGRSRVGGALVPVGVAA